MFIVVYRLKYKVPQLYRFLSSLLTALALFSIFTISRCFLSCRHLSQGAEGWVDLAEITSSTKSIIMFSSYIHLVPLVFQSPCAPHMTIQSASRLLMCSTDTKGGLSLCLDFQCIMQVSYCLRCEDEVDVGLAGSPGPNLPSVAFRYMYSTNRLIIRKNEILLKQLTRRARAAINELPKRNCNSSGP